MGSIAERVEELRAEIPAGVELVAVSKFQPVEAIKAAYSAGQRLFGESRVQELLEKITQLPEDISWHFIGHLQTNKVKQIIGKTSLIESVDSVRLIELIEKESAKSGVTTEILLQLHVAREETKFGFLPEEAETFMLGGGFKKLKHTRIRGLMAMASNTDDEKIVREDFARAASVFRKISDVAGTELTDFNILSMGMSGDWPIAVEEGSNLIRVGSSIFGERKYN